MKEIFQLLFIALLFQTAALCQTQNPFSIIRSDSVTEEIEHAAVPVEIEESTKLEGDNPFSVSHIPIRKNQYKEIEQLAISSKVEENISLSYLPLWLIISSLCLLVYMLFTKKDHLGVLVRSLSNENFMRMTNYEENGGKSVPYIVGYLIFLLNLALFIFLYVTKHLNMDSTYLYLKILGITVLLFIGKHFVNTFFSWVFHLTKESKLYDFTIVSIYNLMSIVFLSLNILIVFGPFTWLRPLAVVGVLFFIISLLSRYYKGLRIGHSQLNSYFIHFFLYFCAFEFSPWVLVYTVIKNLI